MRDSFVIGQYDWLKTQGGRPAGERRYAILRVSPTESRDLVEAVETVFGPDGMDRLLEGDLDQTPGETFAHRIQAAAPILHALVDAGRDVTVALNRVRDDWRSLEEAKAAEQEEKRVRERTVVIEKTHDHVRDEGDVWEL